jgi:hypothetical protein
MKYPFASPLSSLPKYSAPIDVVAIMTMFDTTQAAQAMSMHILRPSFFDGMPAVPEDKNAPNVMRLEMSCCLSVDKFHPRGVSGASWPNTFRNPGIACRPPMRPKSMPYWKGESWGAVSNVGCYVLLSAHDHNAACEKASPIRCDRLVFGRRHDVCQLLIQADSKPVHGERKC